MVTRIVNAPFWQSWGLLIARLIITVVFLMAAAFKFMGIDMTAAEIASVGIPFALPLAWLAAVLELSIAVSFLTGRYLREAALVSIVYIIFLAVTFHGPSLWTGNQAEFGFFVDHFTFVAGFLFMLAHGPGRLSLGRSN
jgi:putative oxidoreductase